MLFTYKYITHDVEKFQKYLDFLFKEVWLKADGDFNFSKLADNPELKEICEKLEVADTEWGNFFNDRIARIYEEFAKLNTRDKQLLAQLYDNNNNIEGLCTDKSITPISYKELGDKHPDLMKVIKSFYDKLYGNDSPFNLKLFGFLNKEIIPKHYKEFMQENTEGICPFCGIHPIKDNNSKYREAYDHYIPKGIYPFVSLNFKNLAPMCHECNSTYKGTKVPIENDDKERKLAFYPYAYEHPELKIEIKLQSKDILKLKPEDIILKITSENHKEEIDSWKRVFEIEERYKELICKKNEGIAWISQIIDEFENAKEMFNIDDIDRFFEMKLSTVERYPLTEHNFLKKGFLEECKKIGLLNANA